MAFSTGSNRNGSCEINVTPLIDVLLVLLIIFMVIVPEGVRGLEAAMPRPADRSSSPDTQDVRPVLIEARRIAEDAGDYAALCVEGRPVSDAAVEGEVRQLLESRPARQVLIEADAKFNFGVVADLVDRAHSAGAEAVGMLRPGQMNGCSGQRSLR